MRTMLRRKLKSCDGVSLVVAMLMFMGCAVVGTLVLTAATTVGGRLKDLTELDQRYYSAASAVSLLKEELCGHPVTIERKKTVTVTTIETTDFSDEENPTHSMDSSETVAFQTTIGTGAAKWVLGDDEDRDEDKGVELGQLYSIPEGRSFLTWMAVSLLFGGSLDAEGKIYCNTDQAMDYRFAGVVSGDVSDESDPGVPDANNVTSGFFWLAHSANEILPSSDTDDSNMIGLAAKCDYQLKKNGTLTLKVKDNTPFLENNHYTMNLTLTPEFAESPLKEKSTLVSSEVSDDGTVDTVVTETVSTRSATVSWTVGGVR